VKGFDREEEKSREVSFYTPSKIRRTFSCTLSVLGKQRKPWLLLLYDFGEIGTGNMQRYNGTLHSFVIEQGEGHILRVFVFDFGKGTGQNNIELINDE
jgi:hypothetical protein